MSDSNTAQYTAATQASASDSLVGESIAVVQGQPVTQLPLDLYIPPDALEVILEQFEGPLDLLLYLIRKQNLDILQVHVADIVEQYLAYIDAMQALQLELAGEYLVMASLLMEIKSRAVLPRQQTADEDDEEDPKAELIRRLLEYEQFKLAAETLDTLPRMERDTVAAQVEVTGLVRRKRHPDIDLQDVLLAMADVLRQAERLEEHEVSRERLSTRERMSFIMAQLQPGVFTDFETLFDIDEGRGGVVVTFLAVLELVKESVIELIQNEAFGAIHVRLSELDA